MTEAEARGVLERALGCATADQVEVRLEEENEAATRFANNVITQNVVKREATLSVRAAFENRVGRASVNDFSEASLRQAVARAEEIARQSSPDTEFMPLPGPQDYPTPAAFDPEAAGASPEARAAAIRAATGVVERRGLNSAGSYTTGSSLMAVANSAGLFATYAATRARFVDTVMSDDSSGWAQAASHRWSDVRPEEVAAVAAQKAEACRAPREIEPGEYTVILEPSAVVDYLGMMFYAMDAKAADEGRSAFSGRRGERVGSPLVTLTSDPAHAACPASPVGEDGLPAPPVTWVEEGILRSLVTSRYWSEKTGQPFTGRPSNWIMRGGEATVDDLVATVDHGLLVTRLWYIRYVDPMKLLLTGMTRDGLFRIENGKVQGGVKNMRFNDSPLRTLERVTALGQADPLRGYGIAAFPALRVDGFRFTSGTAF